MRRRTLLSAAIMIAAMAPTVAISMPAPVNQGVTEGPNGSLAPSVGTMLNEKRPDRDRPKEEAAPMFFNVDEGATQQKNSTQTNRQNNQQTEGSRPSFEPVEEHQGAPGGVTQYR